MEAVSTFSRWSGPSFVSGEGCWLSDEHGERYFDASAGSGALNLGHQHPDVVQALVEQGRRLIHTGCKVQSEPRRLLMSRLADELPYRDPVTLPTVIGTEAIEAAIKVARAHTKRRVVLGFERSYHGKSTGALSLNWREELRCFSACDPDAAVLSPAPRTGLSDDDAISMFGDAVSALVRSGRAPAAVFIEPIQATEGVHVLSQRFLAEVARIARACGALVVFDEIYTGFGRTGTMFYHQQLGIVPDLLVVGKALANGLPIGAVCGPAEVVNSLGPGVQTSTFSGSPLVCGVAAAVLRYSKENDVSSAARSTGMFLRAGLEALSREQSCLGAPRGVGLMLGFDCLDSQRRPSAAIASELGRRFMEEKLVAYIGGPEGASVRLTPPLVMTKEDVMVLLGKISHAASRLSEKLVGASPAQEVEHAVQ
jgi:4-aminobutyrate aminotransferase-like enzyme